MSIVSEILSELSKKSLRYRGVTVNIFGLPQLRMYARKSIRDTFYQLKNKNLVAHNNGIWEITPLGKKYVERKYDSLQQFNFTFPKNAPKNLLVIFDIPETHKAHREWFRLQLKKAHYVMIQRSVWVGPSPLPKEFLSYVKQIKLGENIKTFKLAKSFTP